MLNRIEGEVNRTTVLLKLQELGLMEYVDKMETSKDLWLIACDPSGKVVAFCSMKTGAVHLGITYGLR